MKLGGGGGAPSPGIEVSNSNEETAALDPLELLLHHLDLIP